MKPIKEVLNEFDPKPSLAAAFTAPSSWYTNPDFFQMESELLKKSWQLAAPVALLKEPGSYLTGQFLNEPYIIVKGEDGEVRAFFNVCRHHATCVAGGKGKLKKLICPYHGWTYGLQGNLLETPGLGAVENFSKESMGLVPIALQIKGPFVFLNFSRNPEPMPQDWNLLFERLNRSGYESLHFVCRREYEIKCNWKVYVDNYLDGGYHVKNLHKGLAGQLDLQNYKIENFSSWTLQSCSGAGNSERIGSEALYAWLYPNAMINRYGSIMDINWVIPVAPDRCLTVFDYYFANPNDKEFIEKCLIPSDKVQREDIAVSESVQLGLASSAYVKGRYSAEFESGMHLFHQWLHRDLSCQL